jgi:hypothetical protein
VGHINTLKTDVSSGRPGQAATLDYLLLLQQYILYLAEYEFFSFIFYKFLTIMPFLPAKQDEGNNQCNNHIKQLGNKECIQRFFILVFKQIFKIRFQPYAGES